MSIERTVEDKENELAMMDGYEGLWIEVRRNNAITNDPCALCGERCDPCGLDFFLRDSEALVCVSCARKHSPQLIEALHNSGSRDFDDFDRSRR